MKYGEIWELWGNNGKYGDMGYMMKHGKYGQIRKNMGEIKGNMINMGK